jgi:STE24 endopeptidase
MIALSVGLSAALFALLGWLIRQPQLGRAFGIDPAPTAAALVFAVVLYGPVDRLLSPWLKGLSRKHEFEADAFAAQTTDQPLALIESLKALSRDNASHLTPHPLKVWFDYTHPPVTDRIARLKSLSPHSSIAPGAARG